jgi:hypothetical protein
VLDSSPAAQAAVFFSLTDFCFCLSALPQQGFVFLIFSLFLIHRTARTTHPCQIFLQAIVLLFWCRELAARLPVTACSSFPPVPACATATVLML